MKKIIIFIGLIVLSCIFSSNANAALLFSDTFDSGARPEWGNEIGSWYTSGGIYDALYPSNNRMTYSSVTSLPSLTDFVVELDINSVSDGGVWLRSSDDKNGVVLITGGSGGNYNGIYWHIMQNDIVGSAYGLADYAGLQGSNIHLKVEVTGDTYSAYLNGATTPTSTIVTSAFSSGKVALYDYSGQTFDNVAIYGEQVVPEPASMLLFGLGLLGAGAIRNRKRV